MLGIWQPKAARPVTSSPRLTFTTRPKVARAPRRCWQPTRASPTELTATVPQVPPYRQGEFYLRELPPLRAVLRDVADLRLLVVDGYVDLDALGRPGMGAHAHGAFGVPVIGVAKTAFPTATHALQVLRGKSTRPLFITAAGVPVDEAADLVRNMAGRFRIPDVMRRADALARTGVPLRPQGSLPEPRRYLPGSDTRPLTTAGS